MPLDLPTGAASSPTQESATSGAEWETGRVGRGRLVCQVRFVTERDVRFQVLRYRPESGRPPFYQEYTVPCRDDTVVLDALNYIKDQLDPTLAFRWSCRMGICGSCGMEVNGQPRLTCGTFVRDVTQQRVRIEPLTGFNTIKDLVVDFEPFMKHLLGVQPWIIREKEEPVSKGEYIQYHGDLIAYRQQSLCINCVLCYAACPVFMGDKRFTGPAALALALRYERDTRDQGYEKRLKRVSTLHGAWECVFVGECTVVCPKDVDPAGSIQTLKFLAMRHRMRRLLLPKAGRRKGA